MKQLTEKQAISIAQSGEWKNWNDEEIVRFQLFQDRLCMDFCRFHEAIEKVLGRPVFTHEFAYKDAIIREYLGEKERPTFNEVINLIPKEKRIVIEI